MSELTTSIEKSVEFMKVRYPQGHPLLSSMEKQLESLIRKQERSVKEAPSRVKM